MNLMKILVLGLRSEHSVRRLFLNLMKILKLIKILFSTFPELNKNISTRTSSGAFSPSTFPEFKKEDLFLPSDTKRKGSDGYIKPTEPLVIETEGTFSSDGHSP